MPAVADAIDLGERFMILDMIQLTARHGTDFLGGATSGKWTPSKDQDWKSRLFTRSINWDPAFRKANRWIDRYVAALRIEDRSARQREMNAITLDLKTLKQKVSGLGWLEKSMMGSERRGEMIGNIIIGLMMPAVDKIRSSADRTEQVQRNLDVAFALAAFQRDHGRYPVKLDELAPAYLDRIPDDLFSNKALIYRPNDTGYLLYSVGPDGKDDGGRGYDDEPRGDDVSVRVPTPSPRSNK